MEQPKFTISDDGKTLTITCDISGPGTVSKSRKSRVLCSTRGNKSVNTPHGAIKVGINIYRPNR